MYNRFDAKPIVPIGKKLKPGWSSKLTDVVYLNALEMINREGANARIREFNIYGHRKDLDLISLKKLVDVEKIGTIAKKKIIPNSIDNKILIEVILEELIELKERKDQEYEYLIVEQDVRLKRLHYEVSVLNNEKYEA